MSDRLGFMLAALAVLVAIGGEMVLWQADYPLFLVRKGGDLVEYLTFWR
jgi:hypothetical protein